MQHYGAPTRLLDWTYSPFVAAFFAFQQLSRGCAFYEIDLSSLSNANASRLKEDWREGILNGTQNFVAPFLPNYQNERLILQQGLFLVPGNILSSAEDIVDSYSDKDRFIVKYIFELPPRNIQEAIKKLKAMNIDDFRLFPGIEGLIAVFSVADPPRVNSAQRLLEEPRKRSLIHYSHGSVPSQTAVSRSMYLQLLEAKPIF